jgi:GTP cyclohydrolase I
MSSAHDEYHHDARLDRFDDDKPPIQDAVRDLLTLLDPAPEREGLKETPDRVIKAWMEWTKGHSINPEKLLKTFKDGADNYDEMVFVGAIPFYSTCEHHLAPFFGVAHVGYIPDGKIVGLSKLPRLVEAFARRLSVQERITTQVADTLDKVLQPRGVGVVMQARHMCMESRGINRPGTVTTTAALRGKLKTESATRAEFYKMIDQAKGVGIG